MAGLWFETALLPAGWSRRVRVVLADGLIVEVQDGVEPRADDERHAIALPGLPNLHSHAFQRAMAGRAERRGARGEDFWSWRALMYRLAGTIGPDELEDISALAFAEMLERGFTRVGEFHYLHHDRDGVSFTDPAEMAARLAAAAAQTGIGLTLLPVFYAHSGFGGLEPEPAQARFVTDLDGYASLLEASRGAVAPLADANVGAAPHSLRAVTPDELAALIGVAGGGPIHIHIAEQAREVEDCLAWSGRRPVEWLLANAEVDARWCLVHATHVIDAELDGICARGATVGLCPITEANLGDGIFPAGPFFERGGAFGIGSDSNVLIDAAEELRLLEYGQRLAGRRRGVLAEPGGAVADAIYHRAVAGGRVALAMPAEALRSGAPATFISLDALHPSLADAPSDEILSRWIFAAGGSAVDCVWRLGRKVVAGGRHVDRAAIQMRYREATARIGAAGPEARA
jgi:formiminoglutamate deiminase